CTDGPPRLKPADAALLSSRGIAVEPRRIAGLEGEDHLERIVFQDGASLQLHALFFSSGQDQRSDLAARLGCLFTRKGAVRTGKLEGTNIHGLYVAGDASKDVQLAIIGAAEGVKAAIAIHTALEREDL